MKWFCISWVVLIVGYMIAAYWWAARAEKRINEQIKRCMDDLEKTVGEHKKGVEAPVRARRQGVPGETKPDPEIAGRRKVDCMEQEPRKQRVE